MSDVSVSLLLDAALHKNFRVNANAASAHNMYKEVHRLIFIVWTPGFSWRGLRSVYRLPCLYNPLPNLLSVYIVLQLNWLIVHSIQYIFIFYTARTAFTGTSSRMLQLKIRTRQLSWRVDLQVTPRLTMNTLWSTELETQRPLNKNLLLYVDYKSLVSLCVP